jgi:protein translocase subunit secG
MYTLLLIVHVMVSLFLIFIILIQSGKGEGLSDVFGGGSSQTTIFGTRTGTFLTKATTVSAVVLC